MPAALLTGILLTSQLLSQPIDPAWPCLFPIILGTSLQTKIAPATPHRFHAAPVKLFPSFPTNARSRSKRNSHARCVSFQTLSSFFCRQFRIRNHAAHLFVGRHE